jgi:hypothetical protein
LTDTSASSFYREPPHGDLPRWVVAGIAVVALHVGIVAFLLTRQPDEPAPPIGEVVEVDLEPPAPELHAATQAEKVQEATAPQPEEKPAPEPEPVKPPPPTPEPVTPPPPPEPTPPPPPAPEPPPVPPPPTPEPPPPPVAVAPTPVPDLPVLPKVEAPLEQAKPDPAVEMAEQAEAEKREVAREQAIKRQQDLRREKQRQERVEKEREDRRQEAKRKAEQGRRDAERRAATSRERAAPAGRDSHNSVAHQVSGAELSAWKSGIASRIRASAQNYADQGASSAVVSFFVSASGQIGRVSGNGPAAQAVRAVGSVDPPPDGVGHPFTVPIRFK